ncbi:hypothetical protein GOBAR_AA20964 [Gossypium barbadense]|uniref:Uncharacterized protein n=1 Tax=Gossypium barbadense TaxID=3634 RepID=A0A2P5X8Q9_GOSBA|nr:hypothetical protein GOBAR_AA20964 [Gossypium barbadense]
MLTKFISVSETRFQNTKTSLKNQQASIQVLKTQIGQLAKLISERPQGSLPSNTESNPREQLNTITTQGKEGIHEHCSNNNKEPIYEERRLQIKELDEWQTQKLRAHDRPKTRHDELNDSRNQLKVGDNVLLDATDPHIATPEPNGVIPLTVLSIFPYGTVEVIHPKFGILKACPTAVCPNIYINPSLFIISFPKNPTLAAATSSQALTPTPVASRQYSSDD